MRIVLSHVYSWPEVRRGGERYLHELASALLDAGHDVHILSSAPEPARTTTLGVPVNLVKRRRVLGGRLGPQADEFAFAAQAASRTAFKGVDVWHALGCADAAAASLLGRVRGVRSAFTALGVPYRWYWETRPDRRLHEIVVKDIDNYVCLSRAAADAVVQGWGRCPDVVGGGVDLRRFTPAPARHPRPALLYSGTLSEPRKNVAMLIEAVGILRRRYADLELWLSGPGDPSTLLEASPPEGREAVVVLDVGSAPEQSIPYGRAWATVLPSKDEAFGLSLVESLACGTPIVVLAEGGGPAEIARPGTGVASGASALELAEACEVALDLARQGDTVQACRAEAALHDWRKAVVPKLERLYQGS
jgi:glycosyltransferase involved in cell wall biosynthesis